jgi:hypothetical protein
MLICCKALVSLLVVLNGTVLIQQLSDYMAMSWLFNPILDFAASVLLLPLIYLGDQRKHRSSTVIVVYLFTSLVLDILHLLFPENSRTSAGYSAENFTLICLKCAICFSEDSSKEKFFIEKQQSLSAEECKGIINRSFLWWLRGLFATAATRTIMAEDVYELPEDMRSCTLASRLAQTWKKRSKCCRPPLIVIIDGIC